MSQATSIGHTPEVALAGLPTPPPGERRWALVQPLHSAPHMFVAHVLDEDTEVVLLGGEDD